MEKNYRQSVLIANNIRSVANIGSLFRICESLDLGLILQGITPHPKVKNDTRLPYVVEKDEKAINKTAVHTIKKVNWQYFETDKQVIDHLKKQKFSIYSLEEGVSTSLNIYSAVFKPKTPYALVLGHEVNGVSKYFLKNSQNILYLPMKGTQSSINVAVSAAVAAFEIHRRLYE